MPPPPPPPLPTLDTPTPRQSSRKRPLPIPVPQAGNADSHYNQSVPAASSSSPSLLAKIIRTKNVAIANLTRKRLPMLGRVIDKYHAASPRVRALVFLLLVVKKLFMTFVVLPLPFRYFFIRSSSARRLTALHVQENAVDVDVLHSQQQQLRVLYLLTHVVSRHEQDHGEYVETLLSILSGVEMGGLAQTFATVVDLDIYLLLGYDLSPTDRERIAVPHGVGLEIWDEIVAEDEQDDGGGEDLLAKRQYLVFRDKLMEYDVFVSTHLSSSNIEGPTDIIGPSHFWNFICDFSSRHGIGASRRDLQSELEANVRNGSSAPLEDWDSSPAGSPDIIMVLSENKQAKEKRRGRWIANQAGMLTIISSKCRGDVIPSNLEGARENCQNITQ